jgi:hypothetical protein
MDQHRLRPLTRSLTRIPSRRDVLRGRAAASLGLGVARFPGSANAKKKGKKKRSKKAKPNAFGCLEVGDACKNAAQCCSGICQGNKCRAHDAGTCGQDLKGWCLVASAEDGAEHICNNNQLCRCHRTTAGSAFCADFFPSDDPAGVDPRCADCKKDADCLALGFPPGSACAPVSQGYFCAGACPTGMACLAPCGTELPDPEGP